MSKLVKGSQEAKDHMNHLRTLRNGTSSHKSFKSGYVRKMIASDQFDIKKMRTTPSKNLILKYSKIEAKPVVNDNLIKMMRIFNDIEEQAAIFKKSTKQEQPFEQRKLTILINKARALTDNNIVIQRIYNQKLKALR